MSGSFECKFGAILYFYHLGFKESPELVRRIEAAEKHFSCKDHMHWYNRAEIEERCMIALPLKNLHADPNVLQRWPTIFDDLKTKSSQSLACIGLAMHNLIVKDQPAGSQEEFQHQKIFTR